MEISGEIIAELIAFLALVGGYIKNWSDSKTKTALLEQRIDVAEKRLDKKTKDLDGLEAKIFAELKDIRELITNKL